MMAREEAIAILQEKYNYCKSFYDLAARPKEDYAETAQYLQALQVALTALRSVSREQVEKVKGEWIWDTNGLYPKPVCSKCGEEPYRRSNHTSDLPNYCPKCGCPMTDEVVEMVMERINKLEGVKNELG